MAVTAGVSQLYFEFCVSRHLMEQSQLYAARDATRERRHPLCQLASAVLVIAGTVCDWLDG
jgi:hypothetical protein